MYAAQPNGADSATINPAALNSDLIEPASRGIKRSRSPDDFGDAGPPGSAGDDGGDKPRKRGRPMKPRPSGGVPESASATIPPLPPTPQTIPPQTPQSQNASLPAQTPTYAPPQASPPKSTPTKSTLKALPTVRDHTTDQLGPGGDEYLPREIDEAGEKKVMPNGMLTGNREYRCRTFLVPNRGDKLFMLATECARVLGYRDSYLLFNKNRSLYKIIASQVEKDDLVSQEILPFSYRSRQIAIVTARSMFRQFGSRVIVGGRRVRDDYWETKARKQGFTEADPAGEKRPGASKAREAETNHSASILGAPHGEIVYSTNPGQFGGAPQPQLMQPDFNDTRSRDYSGILKTGPRQEITGPPYQDRIQPSPISELHAQAHHTAEFNRSVSQQREMRNDYMQSIWRRPHEQPTPTTLSQPVGSTEATVPTSRTGAASHSGTSGLQQPGLLPNQSPLMMTAAPYSQPIHAQNPIGQSSVGSRPAYPSSGSSAGALPQTTQNYSYVQSPMWPPTPQTPQHHGGYSAYTTAAAAQSQSSPHPQQSPAGSGPQQHQQQQHQGQHQQQHQQSHQQQQRHSSVSSGPVPPQGGGAGLSYSAMPGYAAAAAAAAQGMYPADQTPRGYMHPNPAQAAGAGGAAGVNPQAAWSQAPQAGAGQWWGGQPQ